jgi:SAM-dependent methyltransferase
MYNINFHDKSKLEEVPCNLCGKDDYFLLAENTCLCRNCGLIYINPRMTKEEYDEYYKTRYREDRGERKRRREADEEKNFEAARKFGRALVGRVRNFIKPGLTIDVGSSTGGVLYGLREEVMGLEVLGIEPSAAESEFANKNGIKTIRALFEDFHEKIQPASNILCVQSLNHLLNPRGFFEWARENLKENGHLILAVKNFRQQVRRAGRVESAIQIDHPYMFVPETLKLFVESCGFRVAYEEIDEGKSKAELALKKAEGLPRQHILLVAKRDADFKRKAISNPDYYRKLRFQLWKPYLRIYNFLSR